MEGLSTRLEILTDYNNLQGFIGTQKLLRRQAGRALKLTAYNFKIKHCAGKTNPADRLLRRLVGASKANIEATNILLTLQQKLQLARV